MTDYRSYFRDQTICALITPPGTGGVAIVRVSGKLSKNVVQKVFSKDPHAQISHTVSYGKMYSSLDRSLIDEGLCVYMQSPHSFTGEDVIELQFHGGNFIAKKILESLIHAGAEAAYPGEFSFRAYRNGKIDLIQAQGIQEMIAARSEKSLKAAQAHLEGKLSKHLTLVKKELLELAAILEAWVDFPEEGLEFMSFDDMLLKLETQKNSLQKLVDSFKTGQLIFEGATICLVGEPNVGKSSLMNALLGKARAIVTPIAGTTRDVIEEDLKLYDLVIRLKDTAGIRDTDEVIEKEGIFLSLKALKDADLVLFIKDASLAFTQKEKEILSQIDPSKAIFIANKMDQGIVNETFDFQQYYVSAKFDQGLEELKQVIYAKLVDTTLIGKEDQIITDERQKNTLIQVIEKLDRVILSLKQDISCEFVVIDLKEALKTLSELVGLDVTEDVLTSLFSKFCVGK
jgi:tRNA modification GTPase